MNWKGTLLLIIVAAAAAFLLLFSRRGGIPSPDSPLLTLAPGEIDRITIREANGEILLRKTSGIWRIASGTPDRADPQTVTRILSAIPDLVPLDTLSPHELKGAVSLQSLGLAPPKRSLSFGAGTRKETLSFGAEGAAKGRIYAKKEGERSVYLLPADITQSSFLIPESFRDGRLTSLQEEEVRNVSVMRGNGRDRLELRREGSAWSLLSPVRAPADPELSRTWISSLIGAHVLRWMPPGTDPGDCGLTSPEAVVAVEDPLDGRTVTIALGGVVPGSAADRFATCSDRPGICVVGDVSRFLETPPTSLRSRHPLPFQNDAVDRIEISYPGQPSPVLISRRKGSGDWDNPESGIPIAGVRVDAWLSGLKELPVADFLAPSQEQFPSGDLSRPTHIRLIAHLSENSAEERAGDMVLSEFSLGGLDEETVTVSQKGSDDLLIVPSSRVRSLMGECRSWLAPTPPAASK